MKKTKIINAVMAGAVLTAGICGCSSKVAVPDETNSAGVECFVWNYDNTKITSYNDYGKTQENIIIPGECKGFTGSLSDGAAINVSFASNDDISLGSAFAGAESLQSIVLPISLTSLDPMCFQNCTSLRSIVIPENVTVMPTSAFNGDVSLDTVTFNGDIETIDAMCFYLCESLKYFSLPDSLETIGSQAFCGCAAIDSIELPDSVTVIDDQAFTRCSSLESITLPASLQQIGSNVFFECPVTEIYVPADMELTEYESNSFYTNSVYTVYVTEGSWADVNFDDVFPGMVKEYQ